MSQPYTKETQKILSDFMEQLAKQKIDTQFLAELRRMMEEEDLGSPRRIRKAIDLLETQSHDTKV